MSWLRDFIMNGHGWVTALHLISVVCWFAALFYLPRLFVYHAMAEDQPSIDRFKIMERKLYRGIATPSMIATILFGCMLFVVSPNYYLGAGWFQVKLVMILLLVIYHFACRQFLMAFRDDRNTRSHVFYRWFNEVPVLMLVSIIVMVKVKPF